MNPADTFNPAPELVELAQRWPTYLGGSERSGKTAASDGSLTDFGPVEVAVLRCQKCHDEIYPAEGLMGRLGHLVSSHGYRSDGRQFDDRNNLIGHAREH